MSVKNTFSEVLSNAFNLRVPRMKQWSKAPNMLQQQTAKRSRGRWIFFLPSTSIARHYVPSLSQKVWSGVVTDPEQAEDEAVPRTVSMTWGDVCSTEVGSLLKRVLSVVNEIASG